MRHSLNLFLLFILIGCFHSLTAQTYAYKLDWLAPHTYTYVIELETSPQTESYTDFSIPAWRPGRYYLQNYAGAVSHFTAQDASGAPLKWHKTNKDTWRVIHPANTLSIKISYHCLAKNRDAGSSYLAADEVYFNPVNLFMYVPGRLDQAVTLELPSLDPNWKQATALEKIDQNHFKAPTYHDFVDAPTVFAPNMKQLEFEDEGTAFYIHIQGDYQVPAKDDEKIISAIRAICQEQASIFGSYPFDEYHFIYRLLPYTYRHAVEHKNSSSFARPAAVARSVESLIRDFRGVTAHEFWHAWNVKRIRPAALWPYDYSQEQYTSLHWFTEGVTDYYDQLSLIRAELITEEQFLGGMARYIQALENDYAATLVSPSASSFNSWLSSSPYRDPNLRISYYTLGGRLGLAIDLELRRRTKSQQGLDQVFIYLYQNYYLQGLGVPEDGVQMALETLSEDSWETFFADYVHGTKPYDYEALFATFGLELSADIPQKPGLRGLGIIVSDNTNQGLLIRKLHAGGDASKAGLAEGDIVLEIEGESVGRTEPDDLVNEAKVGQALRFKIFRGGDFLELEVPYKQAFVPASYSLERTKTKGKAAKYFEEWVATQTQ